MTALSLCKGESAMPNKPVYAPAYYSRFRCINAACRHSCCVGWEIDVDADALARFDAHKGVLASRLQAGIDRESDPPCFRLDETERCPFLNPNGLCDIITHMGETSLCRICRDHPRYQTVYADRVELGIGLCCEAAADLILTPDVPATMIPLDGQAIHKIGPLAEEPFSPADREPNADEALRLSLRALRDACLALLADRERPLAARLAFMRSLVKAPEPVPIAYAAWANHLFEMERLDPAWDACLDAMKGLPDGPFHQNAETAPAWLAHPAAAPLLAYFLYRHMTSDPLLWRDAPAALALAFAAISTAIILTVAVTCAIPVAEAARLYSAEIEYSEENRDAVLDILEGY